MSMYNHADGAVQFPATRVYNAPGQGCTTAATYSEAKRNLELMWLVNAITPDHGTIAGFVQKNKAAFHKVLRDLTLILKGWGLIDGKLVAIDAAVTNDINDLNQLSTMAADAKELVEPDEMVVIADTGCLVFCHRT